MSATVLITDYGFKNLDPERALIQGAGFHLLTAQCRTAQEVIAAGRDADVLLVQWAPVTAEVIAALRPRLRAVIRYGIGVDNVDLAAAKAHGVAVCNVPDYCIDEVADHAVALALSLARQLPQTHHRTVGGEWKIVPPRPLPAFSGQVFACAGFGRIARAVLTRVRAFGFAPAAYDPFVTDDAFAREHVRRLSIESLFAEAGILSLHLPLTAETRHFVNASRLAAMKPTSVLVNTSRGGLVDTIALAGALRENRLGGAGLDVFETEPLAADHPLRTAPGALLTSHTAWYSEASVPRLQRLAAEEAIRALRGETLRNRVNA